MIILLDNRCLIKVSGDDCETFLQSQFSNDVRKIDSSLVQINAYCQHQGKITAILWIFKKEGNFYLSFPQELKETVLTKLNMFKLMSSVEFKDVTSLINQYGLINEQNDKSLKLLGNLSLYTSRDLLNHISDYKYWEKACIENKIPEIYLSSFDKHTPQALNLDIDEIGLSFTKGCYPGQEVVARMHYLGKPKRRLFEFISLNEVFVGDSIHVANSNSLKSSGSIVRVIKIDSNYHFLATFEVKYVKEQVYLNNDPTKPLTIINA